MCNAGLAADLADNSGCLVNGIVSGGGVYDAQSIEASADLEPYDTPKWYAGFGEAALGLNCDAWNFQADAALHNFTGSEANASNTLTFGSRQAHAGGAIFWRDPSIAAFGLTGSVLFLQDSKSHSNHSYGNLDASSSTTMARIGGFAEYYLSEEFSLGGSAYYLWGKAPNTGYDNGYTVDISQKSFEAALIAKYYPSSNLAISAQANYTSGKRTLPSPIDLSADNHGFALSLTGEYLVPDTALSLFAEGLYANRHSNRFEDTGYNTVADLQATVGIKFAFGQVASTSLAQRDRHGTIDNTSVFMEKLPSLQASESRYYWVKD